MYKLKVFKRPKLVQDKIDAKEIKICVVCKQPKNLKGRKKCAPCRQFESDVKNGRIRTPDYPDTTVARYKEPMQKVEDGFGYYGAITETNDGEHVQCHICGHFYAALGNHIRSKHKMKAYDYKQKFGLRLFDGLNSPNELKKRQDLFNRTNRKTSEDYRKMSVKAQAARKRDDKGKIIAGGETWSMQTRNEKGMCREQTIAKIKSLSERMDGVPTAAEFYREYGAGQANVIKTWFGSWKAALAELDLKTWEKHLAEKRVARKESIIRAMTTFYTQEGHVPQWSDFARIEWLPDQKSVQNTFGTVNMARIEAGLPIVIRGTSTHKWITIEPNTPAYQEYVNNL